jgi:hypothetical protein
METCSYTALDLGKLIDSPFHLPDMRLEDIVAIVAEAARLIVLEPAGTPVVPEPRKTGR